MTGHYYIESGVRRAVAARDAGLLDIPAVIYEDGLPAVTTHVPLAVLHSPKSTVPRDSRYILRVEYPTATLKTQPPPILVQPLGVPKQPPSVPLSQVVLT